MPKFTINAYQTLHDSIEVEVESAEEAQRIGLEIFEKGNEEYIEKYGDLDPSMVVDGDLKVTNDGGKYFYQVTTVNNDVIEIAATDGNEAMRIAKEEYRVTVKKIRRL